MTLTTTYQLSNGVEIPIVGFGTWQTPDGDSCLHAGPMRCPAALAHLLPAAPPQGCGPLPR